MAEKAAEVAAAELKRALAARKRYPKSVSETEVDRLRLAVEHADLQLEQAEYDFETAQLAFPAPALVRRTPERDLASLRRLVEERRITRIVVGLPIHMDGRSGPEAQAARDFARELGSATGLSVEMLDERWTTLEAARALRETGGRRAKRRGELDSVAATLLLRTYLERERATAAGADPA